MWEDSGTSGTRCCRVAVASGTGCVVAVVHSGTKCRAVAAANGTDVQVHYLVVLNRKVKVSVVINPFLPTENQCNSMFLIKH